MHLSMTCPTPPHAGKGGDRLGIYFIVEVMTLPLGPIYWVNPHIYFVRSGEGKQNICVARKTTIYLSLKCSPHSKKRPMYLLSTQLAQLGKGKSHLVWAIISGKILPKPRVLPAWGEWGKSLIGA